MAATRDRALKQRTNDRYGYPVLAGVRIFGKTVGGITANQEAVPAGHANCVKIIGLSEEHADNRDGATGDVMLNFLKGTHQFPVAAATVANIGATVYAADDDTLRLTNASVPAELPAGKLEAIDADGVWVTF